MIPEPDSRMSEFVLLFYGGWRRRHNKGTQIQFYKCLSGMDTGHHPYMNPWKHTSGMELESLDVIRLRHGMAWYGWWERAWREDGWVHGLYTLQRFRLWWDGVLGLILRFQKKNMCVCVCVCLTVLGFELGYQHICNNRNCSFSIPFCSHSMRMHWGLNFVISPRGHIIIIVYRRRWTRLQTDTNQSRDVFWKKGSVR